MYNEDKVDLKNSKEGVISLYVQDKTIDRATLRKIQISQYYMLESFKMFCERNELMYTLDFGSMLGAIRHNGFIPWDDDIDIAMLRNDYDRFLELSKNWNHENIFVQNYHTDPEFVHSFTRLRLNGTLAIQKSWQHLNVHHGIFIDIFPYDTIAGDEAACQTHADEIRKIQSEKMGYVLSKTVNKENLYKLNCRQTTLVSKNNRGFNPDDQVSHMTQGLDTYYESRRYISDFTGASQHMFEKNLFPIPKNYDTILKYNYGDYMKYPVATERQPHHGVIELGFRDDILSLFQETSHVKKSTNSKYIFRRVEIRNKSDLPVKIYFNK